MLQSLHIFVVWLASNSIVTFTFTENVRLCYCREASEQALKHTWLNSFDFKDMIGWMTTGKKYIFQVSWTLFHQKHGKTTWNDSNLHAYYLLARFALIHACQEAYQIFHHTKLQDCPRLVGLRGTRFTCQKPGIYNTDGKLQEKKDEGARKPVDISTSTQSSSHGFDDRWEHSLQIMLEDSMKLVCLPSCKP